MYTLYHELLTELYCSQLYWFHINHCFEEHQRPLSETTYHDYEREHKGKHVTIPSTVTTPEKVKQLLHTFMQHLLI